MKLFTKAQEKKLRANSAQSILEHGGSSMKPVIKLFCPWGNQTWLLTELDDDGRFFGLCDLGFGTPEIGYVMQSEIESVKGPYGLTIERDIHWQATRPISEYADLARNAGRIQS